ncbi:CBK1 kinase activator protein MOB2 [Candida viswanathii]|uniref:CBK1 kinase activator protein MOB2 n=1 Tax=Candida viswanathii TaxID=5486 RepID=A0A367XTE5_9ASCO|nr:CBK1 kinase activator protein MOB2 [Candida viswanathii]
MSFLNTIRGLGRGSKKNKKDLEPTQPSLYAHSNLSGSNLRRTQSPTKGSPTKMSARGATGNYTSSPTKRNKLQQQQQPQFEQQHHHHQQPQQSEQSMLPLKRSTVQTVSSNATSAEPPLFLCEPYVKSALVKGSFKTIVQLPKYVDSFEWLALNIFELFNHLNRFYGVIQEYDTPETCPTMNAGPNTNYLWLNSNGQAVNLPACQYIEYVIAWISNKLNDQSVFPTKNGGAFPPNFVKDCKNITRQMFRIFAHIYYNHFDTIVHLSLEAHWNSFFAHFVSFVKEFNLVDRTEMEPLIPLIDNLEQQGKII